jgi:hypothetical protein
MEKRKALKKAIMEYSGSKAEEKYPSKKAMAKHEKGESKKKEAREEFLSRFKKKVTTKTK